MAIKNVKELLNALKGIVEVKNGEAKVLDKARLAGETAEILAKEAAVSDIQEVKETAQWLLWEIGISMGIRPASIHELYMARGKGDVSGFTVPAVNIRGMTFHTARALLKAAKKIHAGAFIFEIAKSEMGYTSQRPGEYVSQLVAAAIAENYTGPIFIQGDHFQANAKKFKENREKEIKGLKDLISESLDAGFYNIDIDTSTLVDLSKPTITEQQRDNFEMAAYLTKFIREKTPAGVVVSVGAEIGEVGKKNSTIEELHGFMKGYNDTLASLGKGLVGLSKMSVQTGTSHGGVVLPDGSIAKVALDFSVLENLGRVGREKYGMSGTVQHGASTLPEEAFDKFPEVGTAEVHLATGFQNILLDSPNFPTDLKTRFNAWVMENCKEERKPTDSEQQFIYKSRKKGLGPFKKDIWNIDPMYKARIMAELEAKFSLIFGKLKIENTYETVKERTPVVIIHKPAPVAAVARQEIDKEGDD